MAMVVKDLGLNVEYYTVGQVVTAELYGNVPVKISFLDSLGIPDFDQFHSFQIQPLSKNTFRLFESEDDEGKIMGYGKTVKLDFGEFVVLPTTEDSTDNSDIEESPIVVVNLYPRASMVDRYIRSVTIKEKNKSSSVVQLSLYHPLKKKAQDILNNLIAQYNKDAIGDRNSIAENTSNFIAERLNIISRELDSVETTKETFKVDNNLTNIESEAQLFIENESLVQRELVEVSTQMSLVKNMLRVLDRNSGSESPLPSNIGIADAGLEASITRYNQLVLERNRILKGATDQNPIVVTLNDQLVQLKSSIRSSLENNRTSLQIRQSGLYGQKSRVNSEIASVPQKEKEFLDIERQRAIKEALYVFLLQKREETSISLTVTAPVAKIIDDAYTVPGSVSPNRKMILLGALLLGLLLPFSVIYLRSLLDTKIHNSQDIERITGSIPILGDLPKFTGKNKKLVHLNDRSILAESFRILRTNLAYLIKTRGGSESNKIIYITSSILGEGKTFVAYNLAKTLSSTNKKVLLLGADIRSPQLQRYTPYNKTDAGLCEYLYEAETTLEQIIRKADNESSNFDVILSGRIPPNPAELLMSDRLKVLFDKLKDQYDYILVDTAPTMMVSDTLLISQYADITLYVARADYTDKKAIQLPIELVRDKKLNDVAFVVNNVAQTKFGYQTKYEYGEGEELFGWRKFVFRLKRRLAQ